MQTTKRRVLIGLGIIIVLGAIAVAAVRMSGRGAGRGLTPVSLATSKNMWCALSHIAKGKGYFEEEGLDVTFKYQDAGRYCLDAVLSNSADFGNIVEVNVAYVAFTGNQNLSVVGTIVRSTSSAIVARKSGGVQKPQDLRGKILALSPGTTSDVFAHRFLDKYGLSEKDVQIRKIQPVAMQSAVAAKGVDAASTWQPFIFNIRRAIGEDIVCFVEPDIYTGYENIVVRKDWGAKNAETVKAFLRAMRKAADFAREHRDEAMALVSERIALELDIVSGTWDDYDFTFDLDKPELVNAIRSIGNWIHATQEQNKPVPDYQTFVDSSYLEAIAK